MADFSGLNKAIENLGESAKESREREQRKAIGNAMAQAKYGEAANAAFRQGNLDTGLGIKKYETELSNTAEAKSEKQRKAIAGFIQQHIVTDQDPTSRATKWQKFLTINPNAASLPKAYHDPMYGPDLILSEAGVDPLDRESKQADIDYKGAQTGKLNRAGGFESVKDRLGVEEGLRKEYAGLAKPYFEVRDAYTRVEESAKDPSAAGDLALIFNYMKMLDPGSVVREGEFATAQNAAGVPDQVRNMFNRLLNGERMNPAQREDFVARARQLYQGQERQYLGIQDQYRGISERIGVDPRNTILDYTRPQTPGLGGAATMPDRPEVPGGGQGQIPPGAVRLLQSNPSPEIVRQFEQKYGVPANQFLQGR